MCISLVMYVLLGQECVTDTSKYTHYTDTACLSFILQTCLSREETRFSVTPLNLTVLPCLCSRRSASCHNWSQPVTDGHNQVKAVTYCNVTAMASAMLWLRSVHSLEILRKIMIVHGHDYFRWLKNVSKMGTGLISDSIWYRCDISFQVFVTSWTLAFYS